MSFNWRMKTMRIRQKFGLRLFIGDRSTVSASKLQATEENSPVRSPLNSASCCQSKVIQLRLHIWPYSDMSYTSLMSRVLLTKLIRLNTSSVLTRVVYPCCGVLLHPKCDGGPGHPVPLPLLLPEASWESACCTGKFLWTVSLMQNWLCLSLLGKDTSGKGHFSEMFTCRFLLYNQTTIRNNHNNQI